MHQGYNDCDGCSLWKFHLQMVEPWWISGILLMLLEHDGLSCFILSSHLGMALSRLILPLGVPG